jgi:hypothetical protein
MTKARRVLEYVNNPSTQKLTLNFSNDGSRKAVNRVLAMIARLGSWGSSRTIKHYVDADGAYRVKIRGLDTVDIPDTEDSEIEIPGCD